MAAPTTDSRGRARAGRKGVGIWSRLARPIGMLAVLLIAVFFGVRAISVLVFERLFTPTTSKFELLQRENLRLKDEIRYNQDLISEYGRKISNQTVRIDSLESAIADSFFAARSQLRHNNSNAHTTQQHAVSAARPGQKEAVLLQPPNGNTQSGIAVQEASLLSTDAAHSSASKGSEPSPYRNGRVN